MTPRTFLIDPVKDLNGHHFNMSISFLSASTASGQHPFWPGHRAPNQSFASDSVRFTPLIRKMFPESRIEIYPRRKIGKSYPRERGAGIAIKSLLAEKSVVTTQGTFAARLASRGAATIDSDADSVTDGIPHIAGHDALFRPPLVNIAENSCPTSMPFPPCGS